MPARKFTVTHEDGSVSTRSSKTMNYTHAVEVFSVSYGDTEPSWGVLRWSLTRENAEKAAAAFRKMSVPEWRTARVVEVDQ